MGRPIGAAGETKIRYIIKNGTAWSVPLKSWTDNKELEERRTKVPYQTKSGTLFG
ncbi:hypothetical protein HNR46_004246, partial [Haloferula luteola]|nr:hypothetical protein [Haloferula luteola]